MHSAIYLTLGFMFWKILKLGIYMQLLGPILKPFQVSMSQLISVTYLKYTGMGIQKPQEQNSSEEEKMVFDKE